MPEPSPSLGSQFRRRLKPEDETVAAKLSQEASKEDYDFLRMVATAVPYGAFVNRLSLTAFNRIRALAISDLFEDVDEDTKRKLLGPLDLDECRSLPEFEEIMAGLKKNAEELSNPETAEAWIKEKGGPQARRYLQKVLSQTTDIQTGARAATEIMDREIPRAIVGDDQRRRVTLDDEASRLIGETLEIEQRRRQLPEKTDADPEA